MFTVEALSVITFPTTVQLNVLEQSSVKIINERTRPRHMNYNILEKASEFSDEV
jgi:hypothetical protein